MKLGGHRTGRLGRPSNPSPLPGGQGASLAVDQGESGREEPGLGETSRTAPLKGTFHESRQ